MISNNASPLVHIPESTQTSVQFNVMPERPVSEVMTLREYRVGDLYVEASFDREYKSSMLKSPDHFIFLTGLVHSQKMIYVTLCKYFDIPYEAGGPERLKIWPFDIQVQIPKLIRKSEDLVQRLRLSSVEKREGAPGYIVKGHSDVEGVITVQFEAAVFLVE